MSAYIGFKCKDNTIKSVEIINDYNLDEVGYYLVEHFNTIGEVEDIIHSTIDYIDEDTYETYCDDKFSIYDNVDDYLNENNHSYCYLFVNGIWMVSKPNTYNIQDLETILEEEY